MAFIPHTPDDIARMLEVIGVRSIEDLFDEIPAELRAGASTCRRRSPKWKWRGLMTERAAERRAALELHRRGRLRAPHSGTGVGDHDARRILFRLHAVSGGGQSGHAAADL